MDSSNATGGAFMIRYRTETLELPSRTLCKHAGPRTVVVPVDPCLSGRISAPKGQDMVKEARGNRGNRS
jgi:hypothetical protein